MNKFLAIILVLVLFTLTIPFSFAELGCDMPFQGLWYDQNGIRVYCTNYGLRYYALHSPTKVPLLQFDFTVENGSEKPIRIGIDADFANGWATKNYGDFTDGGLDSGKKCKGSVKLDLSEAGMKTIEELEEFECVLWIDLNDDSYDDERIRQRIVMRSFLSYDENNDKKVDVIALDEAVLATPPTDWPELVANGEAESDMKMQGLWFSKDGVKIYCINYGLSQEWYGPAIRFDFAIENKSEKVINAGFNNDYANGWSIGTIGNFCNNEVLIGKRMRGNQQIDLEKAEITDLSQLEEYEFNFWVLMDNDNYLRSRVEFKMKIDEFPIYDAAKEKLVSNAIN
ncbi:MAG: hypothetical protein IJJ80_00890 [Clostridia bacterium]|nr:hypothetical protein [Clostridia bacterium]